MEAYCQQRFLGNAASWFRFTWFISSVVRAVIQIESSVWWLQTNWLSFGQRAAPLPGHGSCCQSCTSIVAIICSSSNSWRSVCSAPGPHWGRGRHCWTCWFGRMQFLFAIIPCVLSTHTMARTQRYSLVVFTSVGNCIRHFGCSLQRDRHFGARFLCSLRHHASDDWISR